MKDINEVNLEGFAGRDAEVGYSKNGSKITKFSLATSYGKKFKGEWQNKTTWHNIVSFDEAAPEVKKGDRVHVLGRIDVNEYVGRDGRKKTAFQVIANEIKLLDAPERNKEEILAITDDDIPF